MRQFTSQEEYWDFCAANQARLDAALAAGQPGPLGDASRENRDEELLERYTRTVDGQLEVVARLEWDGHSPEPVWEPAPTSRRSLLEDNRYFAHCIWCGARKHRGHLGQHDVCHGCQENYFGIRH